MLVFSLYKCERIPFWQVRVTIFLSLSPLSLLFLSESLLIVFLVHDELIVWLFLSFIHSSLFSFVICYLLFLLLEIGRERVVYALCSIEKCISFSSVFFWQLVRIWLLAASWALCLYNNVEFLSVVWMCRSWGFVVKRAVSAQTLCF